MEQELARTRLAMQRKEPGAWRAFQELLDSDLDLDKLCECIPTHSEIAQELLAEANAPRNGLRRNIAKLDHAIAMIGRQRFRRLIDRYLRTDQPSQAKPHLPG